MEHIAKFSFSGKTMKVLEICHLPWRETILSGMTHRNGFLKSYQENNEKRAAVVENMVPILRFLHRMNSSGKIETDASFQNIPPLDHRTPTQCTIQLRTLIWK